MLDRCYLSDGRLLGAAGCTGDVASLHQLTSDAFYCTPSLRGAEKRKGCQRTTPSLRGAEKAEETEDRP